MKKPERQVPVTYQVRRGQNESLKSLSHLTKIPQSALIREALDDLLEKYRKQGTLA